MPRYTIKCEVRSAAGWQLFSVEADSPEDAAANRGDWEFVDEEIEVTAIGPPEVTEEKE